MIIRQLKNEKYRSFCSSLEKNAHMMPYDASRTVSIAVNGVEYAVKLQPERHNKIAVLQAVKIEREGNAPVFDLITRGELLSSFFEILVYQHVG